MKNEHIVQFLQAFPFNPSCNQLLQKLDEYCQAKTTSAEQNSNLDNDTSSFSNQESIVVEKSNQHTHDLKDKPSNKKIIYPNYLNYWIYVSILITKLTVFKMMTILLLLHIVSMQIKMCTKLKCTCMICFFSFKKSNLDWKLVKMCIKL